MNAPKEYLGDGVYSELVDGVIRLTTENGLTTSNEIYLELPIARALTEYLERAVVINTPDVT